MKTFRHFLWYLAKLLLEWEMFYKTVVQRIKTHILCSITYFRKSHRLWDIVEKLGRKRGATNDVTIWSIRIACWISKATCTYAHAHAHAHPCPNARTHTQSKKCFSTATMIRECASLLRYTYIACIVVSSLFYINHSSAHLKVSPFSSLNICTPCIRLCKLVYRHGVERER
jgi:hypothetical protein